MVSGSLVALALGAGMLAAVNPCGFALLPAYVSLLIADDAVPTRAAAVGRALRLSTALTLGFAAVFLAFGLVVAPVAAQVQQHLPWVTVALGGALAVMGVWLAAGREVRLPRLSGRRPRGGPRPLSRSFGSMSGFGAGYAVASLSCTIAPFLAVVVGGFRSGSVLEGLLLFAAYAAGMGLVVTTLAVATALASPTAVGRLRRAGAWAPRAAGVLLAAAGAYVAYYGWWELRVFAGADPEDPVIGAAATAQRAVADAATALGPGGFALLLALLLAVLVASAAVRRGRSGGVAALSRGAGGPRRRPPG